MENLDDIEEKFAHFRKLINEVNQLKFKYLEVIDENRYLKLKLQEKEIDIENQKIFIKNLENQLKVRNLATETVVSENQQKYISDLLEEIDACLRLLETN
jgi:hypothetical protein